MGLGNNKDYTTRDRDVRRRLAVVKARSEELEGDPISRYAQAANELRDGKLNDRLKAWKDPILEHRRKMRAERAKECGENITPINNITSINELEFRFERRRYERTTYTWAEVLHNGVWYSLGDPWPCITPSRSDLYKTAHYVIKYEELKAAGMNHEDASVQAAGIIYGTFVENFI
jgi:hypothetical protein